MDHAEAIELIELAAVEPDGLERLMAGDTPDSGALAGHLAGCPACAAELVRVRHTASIARDAIAAAPDPALRERTLAFVREVGRDRSGIAAGPAVAARPVEPAAVVVSALEPAAPDAAPRPGQPSTAGRRWLGVAGIAAALVLAVGLGFAVAGVQSPADDLEREVAVLQQTTASTLRLAAMPDAERIALVATDAGAASAGTLVFSPSTGELVMVAEGLAPLGQGEEYGCWVEADGERVRIGRMYAGGDLQSWAGRVDGLADLPADAVFGVSLVPAGGGTGEPLLTGSR
jgi:hypothetical protein